jgi:hypothetical protein
VPQPLATATQELAQSLVAHAERLLADAIQNELHHLNGGAPAELDDTEAEAPAPDADTPTTKRCARCHVVKPLDQFPADPLCADGRRSTCNDCRARRRRTNAKPKTAKAAKAPIGNGAADPGESPTVDTATMLVPAHTLAKVLGVDIDAAGAGDQPGSAIRFFIVADG